MFKLCPRYLCSYDQDAFNSLGNPTAVASYAKSQSFQRITNFELGRGFFLSPVDTPFQSSLVLIHSYSTLLDEFVARTHVVNPLFDYVTPDLVTLFISNM